MAPPTILRLLQGTHWGGGMTPDVLERAIANSVCFGVFERRTLVGFGRTVTDLATYAYWTDVVLAENYRGRGSGRWLSECNAGVGFSVGPGSLIYMERRP